MGRCALQDRCPKFEFAKADSAAECATECTVLDSIPSERGYKGKGSKAGPDFVVDLSEVVFGIRGNQEEIVTRTISNLQSAVFDAKVFRSYVKRQQTVTNFVNR